jgi:hypothetical protein
MNEPFPAAEDLDALAARANAAHEAGEAASRKGLEHFRAAGEALLKAKAQCGHGNWLAWLEKNVRFSERRAQQYMRLAKSEVTADLEAEWQIISGNAPEKEEAEGEPEGAREALPVFVPPLVQVPKPVMVQVTTRPVQKRTVLVTVRDVPQQPPPKPQELTEYELRWRVLTDLSDAIKGVERRWAHFHGIDSILMLIRRFKADLEDLHTRIR